MRLDGPRPRLLTGVAVVAVLALLPWQRGSLSSYGLGTDACFLVLMAVGLQVTYGLSGQLSVAVAPVAGIGAYSTAHLMTFEHWSFWATLPVAAVAGAALGTLVGLPALRVRGDVLALVTLAAGEILKTVYLNTTTFFGAYDGISGVPLASAFGHDLSDGELYAASVAVTLLGLLAVAALVRGPLGRAWRADRDDAVAAAAMGVAGPPLRLLAFTLGSAFAGVGGALYAAHNLFVSSTAFDLPRTVDVILVVLLAGDARLIRTVVAAAGLTVVVDRLAGFAAVSEATTGALVLVVVAQRLGAFAWLQGRARRLVPVRT
jgi:branched-chain amino acid transport system permease protein